MGTECLHLFLTFSSSVFKANDTPSFKRPLSKYVNLRFASKGRENNNKEDKGRMGNLSSLEDLPL